MLIMSTTEYHFKIELRPFYLWFLVYMETVCQVVHLQLSHVHVHDTDNQRNVDFLFGRENFVFVLDSSCI